MSEDIKRTIIRMPENLHKRIQKVAKREKRSVNAQMVLMLEEGVEKRNG